MNSYVADPHWGWWIIWYFFLGGIAAGAYFLAALAELFGGEDDRTVARAGYLLAAPLVAICGVLLIVDLDFPSRFWHMLIDAETWRPHFKPASPMSVGAWALLVFGLISAASFAGAIIESRFQNWPRSAAWCARLHRGFLGRTFDLVGTTCGFFIAAYTGALLTATNQPVWSNSPWLATLFLASAAATGLAAIKFLLTWQVPSSASGLVREPTSTMDAAHVNGSSTHRKLDSLEPWIWILEVIAAGLFLMSLGGSAARAFLRTSAGWAFLGTLGLGLCLPVYLRLRPHVIGRFTVWTAAAAVLLGGFLLRYSIVTAPSAFFNRAAGDAHPKSRISAEADNHERPS